MTVFEDKFANYPASMTGWLILNNLVRGVEKMGWDEGIVGQRVEKR